MLKSLARNRTAPLLVAIQIAITFAVIVNAVFAIAYQRSVTHRPTGMALEDLVWVQSFAYSPNFNYAASVQEDLQRLTSIPGVVGATTINNVPLSGSGIPFDLYTQTGQKGPAETAVMYMATERTIGTLGLRLIAGRNFDPSTVTPAMDNGFDTVANLPPEAIVSQALADRLFPGQTALGRTVYGLKDRPFTIVGIVAQMLGPWPMTAYNEQIALVPAVAPGPHATYVVRARPGERDRVMAAIPTALSGSQPGRIITDVKALDETASQTLAGARVTVDLLGAVLVLVLVISALGVFAAAMFNVIARTKQIGIRRAIGATQGDIARQFLMESWVVTTVGTLIGCVLAMVVGLQLSALLGSGRMPFGYFLGGTVGLWMIALSATFLPARSAASVPPAVATRAA
jgi:putative ABC transport system permease protein